MILALDFICIIINFHALLQHVLARDVLLSLYTTQPDVSELKTITL